MPRSNRLIKEILLRFSFTFICIHFADASAMLVDGFVISRFLGSEAMTAVGLSSPTFAFLNMFCAVFAVGTEILCTNALCNGDQEENQKIFSTAMVLMTVIIFAVTLLGFLQLDRICMLFGAKISAKSVFDLLRSFLLGTFIGIPGYMYFMILSPLVVLDGSRKVVTAATIVQNVLNLTGDFLTVTVFHGGMFGVGLSTGISWTVAAVILAMNVFRKHSMFKFNLKKIRIKCAGEMIKIGSPRFSRYVGKILSRMGMNMIILNVGGYAAMGAIAVNFSLTAFLLAVGLGISDAVKVMTQVIYSEKDLNYLKMTVKSALQLTAVLTVPIAVVLFFLAKPLACLFVTTGGETMDLACISIACMAVSIPFNALNSELIDYLLGMKRIKSASAFSLLHRCIIPCSAALGLGLMFGAVGIFASIPISELLVLLVYMIFAVKTSGSGKTFAEKLMCLPRNFEEDITDDMAFSIQSREDAAGVSEKVSAFLTKQESFSSRVINAASLCVEEAAENVVEHGFAKDNKKHSCDVRIIIENGSGICLRIRDDCPLFDVREKYETMHDAGPDENIGLKLMYKMADKIVYVNILHLNTLIIYIGQQKP